MGLIIAVLHKIADCFASPYLPLDADYSYKARHAEAERARTRIVRGLA